MEAHAELIRRLGGGTALAAILSRHDLTVDREAIYKWQTNGIPWKLRPLLDRIARERGLDEAIPDGFLEPEGERQQQPGQETRSAVA